MIKNFKPRLYQETIFATAAQKNTLVVLPTGLGKTAIALLLIAHRLQQYPQAKIVVLAPTKPLAEQLQRYLQDHLEVEKEQIKFFSGAISPEKRQTLYEATTIIVSTPQTIENDLLSQRLSLKNVSLIVFDEAHRAVGDYAYVSIAEQYAKESRFPRILALTASPGSDKEKILEVMHNLRIEALEMRTEQDPEVKPYVQKVNLQWMPVQFPEEFKAIQQALKQFIKERLAKIKEKGYIHGNMLQYYTKKELLGLQAKLRAEMINAKDFDAMQAISLLAEVMKIEHALELLETQGIHALYTYFEKLEQEGYTGKTKASKNLVKDIHFRTAYIKTRSLFLSGVTHPKQPLLLDLVKKEITQDPNLKIIIFTQYRDNGVSLVEQLNLLEGVHAKLFVGQAKKNGSGLSQKEQLAMIEEFRQGTFNVLVSSSVGEEGLDIPAVDLVIFYEPVPSAIRHIQRRGRTARLEQGRVIILYTKGTRDEHYRWTAHHKEKRMQRNLAELKQSLHYVVEEREIKETKHLTLDHFAQEPTITIIVDHRETTSAVVKGLKQLPVQLQLKQLAVGDYVLSDRVGIEFKTTEDFVQSLIDGRLLTQAQALKQTYSRALFLVQGQQSIYEVRNVHPHALMGALATLTVSYGIPVLFTKDAQESAKLLYFIAKREQEATKSSIQFFGIKKPQTEEEQALAILASIPGIGSQLAKPLLDHFGSIANVVAASPEALQQVPLIGPKKAKQIYALLHKTFSTNEEQNSED